MQANPPPTTLNESVKGRAGSYVILGRECVSKNTHILWPAIYKYSVECSCEISVYVCIAHTLTLLCAPRLYISSGLICTQIESV